MRFKNLVALVICFVMPSSFSVAQKLSTDWIEYQDWDRLSETQARKLKAAVGKVTVTRKAGFLTSSSSSGVVLQNGKYLITTYHTIQDWIDANDPTKLPKEYQIDLEFVSAEGHQARGVRVIESNLDDDIAIIEIDPPLEEGLRVRGRAFRSFPKKLTLREKVKKIQPIEKGQAIAVIGYPMGFDAPIVSEGHFLGGESNFPRTTLATLKGMSGSPVILLPKNPKDPIEVIGVHSRIEAIQIKLENETDPFFIPDIIAFAEINNLLLQVFMQNHSSPLEVAGFPPLEKKKAAQPQDQNQTSLSGDYLKSLFKEVDEQGFLTVAGHNVNINLQKKTRPWFDQISKARFFKRAVLFLDNVKLDEESHREVSDYLLRVNEILIDAIEKSIHSPIPDLSLPVDSESALKETLASIKDKETFIRWLEKRDREFQQGLTEFHVGLKKLRKRARATLTPAGFTETLYRESDTPANERFTAEFLNQYFWRTSASISLIGN